MRDFCGIFFLEPIQKPHIQNPGKIPEDLTKFFTKQTDLRSVVILFIDNFAGFLFD